MKLPCRATWFGLAAVSLALRLSLGAEAPASSLALGSLPSEKASVEGEASRMDEMYQKMRRAVEDIAELYGSPRFVQVFTNDRLLADELRLRLRATDSLKQLNAQIEDLSHRCDRLKAELAKREAEAASASQRLARQRAAMNAVANAVDQANRAVEGTVP